MSTNTTTATPSFTAKGFEGPLANTAKALTVLVIVAFAAGLLSWLLVAGDVAVLASFGVSVLAAVAVVIITAVFMKKQKAAAPAVPAAPEVLAAA